MVGGEAKERIRGFGGDDEGADILLLLPVAVVVVLVGVGSESLDPLASVSSPPVPAINTSRLSLAFHEKSEREQNR